MAKKKSFRRGAPWRRPDGPVISLFREGERLRLDFEYSPTRVAAIKAIKGARYNAGDRSWSVPIAAHPQVDSVKDFPTYRRLNSINNPTGTVLSREDALSALRLDPFSVKEEVLGSGVVEMVVRFNQTKRRILIVPRFGGAAHKVIKKTPAVTYSGADCAYTIPPTQLGELLKKLRDKAIIFGVCEEAGVALRESAALRNEITLAPDDYSDADLAAACLTPFIVDLPEQPGFFRPCFFTTEQFKAAFPGESRKGSAPFSLDSKGLLSFHARRKALPFEVWISRPVKETISALKEKIAEEVSDLAGPIDDGAADVLELPALWRTTDRGRGALLLRLHPDSQSRRVITELVGEILGTTYPSEANVLQIEVPDSALRRVLSGVSQISSAVGLGEIPRSRSFEGLERDIGLREELHRRASHFAALEDIPPSQLTGLNPEEGARLFPHQRVAVEWLRSFPHAFLGDDMGLGKTLSVLSAFSALRRTEGCGLLLVVCPNSLTRNWARETLAWFPELKALVLSGDKSEKAWTLRLLAERSTICDVLIVNYEGVRLSYVTPELQSLASTRKTILCLDESQRVKNHQSKSFKAISTIAPACDRRVLLSGTPTPKDVSDLWAQMRILDGGQRFGRSFYKWLATVAELGTEFSEFAVKRFNEAEVGESVYRAQEIMLRRRKEKVTNLPPKTFSLREIELSGSQRERYEEIREGLILRMRSTSGEQFVREITNILEEYLRAVQVASNPRLLDPEWKGTPAKFLELDEIVNEVVREQGQKLVVWTNYLGNVRELVERYQEHGAAAYSGEVSPADREVTVRSFQADASPKILVAVPAAGGVGITLTAAQTAVYIDKTWNAEHWMQSVDRIHRIGQGGSVTIISLLGCKVDEMIHWNLRRKEQGQAEVLGDVSRSASAGASGPSREELLEALEES